MPRTKTRLAFFERYLSLWVALCMVAGIALGRLLPGAIQAVRSLEFGRGSRINAAIAVLIWLMITPMMMKVDFTAIRGVGRRPAGLAVTLAVNWLIKPFSMALLAWFFFRIVFSPWVRGPEADQYIAGCIVLAAAPCTAMVFVWSHLTGGDAAYTLVQVAVNDLIMLALFVPIVRLLVTGASSLEVPFGVLLWSVIVFIVIPLTAGTLLRSQLMAARGREWFEGTLLPLRAGNDRRVAGDAGVDLRLSGGQHHQPVRARATDRGADHAAGLLQRVTGLRLDEVAEGGARRGGSGCADRREQLLRIGGGDGDRALRARVRRGAGDRGRRTGGGSGDAFRVRGLQSDGPLVSQKAGGLSAQRSDFVHRQLGAIADGRGAVPRGRKWRLGSLPAGTEPSAAPRRGGIAMRD